MATILVGNKPSKDTSLLDRETLRDRSMLGKRKREGRPTPDVFRESNEVWISKSYLVDRAQEVLRFLVLFFPQEYRSREERCTNLYT